jgi:electron transfer flavoprotein alpha subunit
VVEPVEGIIKKSARPEIWVYGDLRNERLFGFGLNVLARARDLAGVLSGKAAMILMGSWADDKSEASPEGMTRLTLSEAAERCISYGADFVYVLLNNTLTLPRADIHAAALANAVGRGKPVLVLFALTDFGREVAARAARICHSGLIAECANLRIQGDGVVAKCPSWGGAVMAEITFSKDSRTGFATVLPQTQKAVEILGEPGVIQTIRVDDPEVPPGLVLLSSSTEPGEQQKLEDAPVVVVGGAGLNNPEDFGLVRELASAVGGEVGATRPPVLQHWVDEERLIGQTGKTVRPNVLFSVGTSGAVQYTAGIMEAETIVAINRDPNSPIFQLAHLGVVADAKTFLPVLTAKIRQTAMRKLVDALNRDEKADTRDGFGAKIRRLRESHKWSVEALAQATGQSPEFVERVENDDVAPPVSFLLRFANALKVDPGTFLRREEKAAIRNQRVQAFAKRTQDYSYQTLSPGAESDHLRAFMITIEPRQTHKPIAYKHEGEEFIFVTDGDLHLTLGNKTHKLRPGESMHFNSDVPHKLKSISNESTRCLVVLYTP